MTTEDNLYQGCSPDIQTYDEKSHYGNENTNEDDKAEHFSFSKTTRSQKWLLVSLGFVNFCSSTCFSLMAPFFPKEVRRCKFICCLS